MAECYKTIEYPDRKAIAALYAAGAKAGQIAKEIDVSPRSIYPLPERLQSVLPEGRTERPIPGGFRRRRRPDPFREHRDRGLVPG